MIKGLGEAYISNQNPLLKTIQIFLSFSFSFLARFEAARKGLIGIIGKSK